MASDDPRETAPAGTPRWVKVFGAVLAVALLLFVALQLAGVGGRHGPGRHGADGDGGTAATLAHPRR